MLKPICVPCRRFYRPAKNGFRFVEGMPIVHDAKPGTQEPEKWKPYKLWMGDKWRCEGCGAEIIVGVGRCPIAERHEPGFDAAVTRNAADFQVNDC